MTLYKKKTTQKHTLNALLPSYRNLPIHVGKETHSHPTKQKQEVGLRRLTEEGTAKLLQLCCELHSLFLEACHWTDVVGLNVVNH